MYQFFSKPDLYLGRCGDLRCEVVARRVPGAPDFMRGVRALFVTDVHATAAASDAHMAALARRIASVAPDLLLWGGDFADEAVHARRFLAHLRGLNPPLGSFGVLGNNDRQAWPDVESLRDAMAGAGMRLLLNASARVELPGGTLIVAGVDEHLSGAPDATGLYPEAASDRRYRVLLSHYPVPPASPPDLMLSGHTHGGQFNLLGVTPYAVGFERVPARGHTPRYISGLHRRGDMWTLVGKGIGASRLPLRVGVRPEVDLLRFG